MKILSWNVRSGGKSRAADIVAAIETHSPDVIILGEYRTAGSRAVLRGLDRAGYNNVALTQPDSRRGGLAIASKRSMERVPLPGTLSLFASRFVAVDFPTDEFRLVGLYGLLKEEPFADYWKATLDELRRYANRATLVLGDFNTGESLRDAPKKNFYCSNYFGELPLAGYKDLWRSQHGPEAREYSWHGRVNGYRLDHAFGSAPLLSRVSDCRYSHLERELRHSDHSPLMVKLIPPAG